MPQMATLEQLTVRSALISANDQLEFEMVQFWVSKVLATAAPCPLESGYRVFLVPEGCLGPALYDPIITRLHKLQYKCCLVRIEDDVLIVLGADKQPADLERWWMADEAIQPMLN